MLWLGNGIARGSTTGQHDTSPKISDKALSAEGFVCRKLLFHHKLLASDLNQRFQRFASQNSGNMTLQACVVPVRLGSD